MGRNIFTDRTKAQHRSVELLKVLEEKLELVGAGWSPECHQSKVVTAWFTERPPSSHQMAGKRLSSRRCSSYFTKAEDVKKEMLKSVRTRMGGQLAYL
jgi:hypothetical protein